MDTEDESKRALRALLQHCAQRVAEALEQEAAEALARADELRRWEPQS